MEYQDVTPLRGAHSMISAEESRLELMIRVKNPNGH